MDTKMFRAESWNKIDWKTVEKQVYKLQKRIYRATQSGDVKRAKSLQRMLIKSYYAKLLAIRKVTQDNKGRKTAGVDGIKSLTHVQRLEMVKALTLRGKAKPTRRVWLLKPNGEKRPLGIPTIEDRAKQCLVKQALEPQWEAKFSIYMGIRYVPKFVLDADIAKCFDQINHEKLLDKLETYPELRHEIKSWLKSGVMDGKQLFPTEEGTPQGGVISPLLANIALHGLELELKKFARSWKGKKRDNEKSLSVVRYADDFVVMHKNLEIIILCKSIVEEWLKEIGLELKPSKTLITHTLIPYEGNVGFDFLGFKIRQYKMGKNHTDKNTKGNRLEFKTIIKPSKDKVKAHLKKIGDMIRKHKGSTQEALISALNPIIRGWANYYSTQCSKDIFSYCDHIVYQQLKRWAERRHPKKSKSWVANKYWHTHELRNWVFSTFDGIRLMKHSG
jgi:RNA-directed DNA polymerase